jgi:hypothetical protein
MRDMVDRHFAWVNKMGSLIANEVAAEYDERNDRFGNSHDLYSGRRKSEIPEPLAVKLRRIGSPRSPELWRFA